MEAVCNDHLNQREARAYLKHVIEDELAQLDQYQTRVMLDEEHSVFREAKELHWGNQLALKMVAENGIHATVTKELEAKLIEDGFCESNIQMLNFCLLALLHNLRSESKNAARAELFRKITGRDALGEIERLQLLQLEIEGRAAANENQRGPAARTMAVEVLEDVSATSKWIVPETAVRAPVDTAANKVEPPEIVSSREGSGLDTGILDLSRFGAAPLIA